MRWLAALLLAIPVSAHAQSVQYQLIITWYQAGIIAIEYPSEERCERARIAVFNAMEKRNPCMQGNDIAFCIPG